MKSFLLLSVAALFAAPPSPAAIVDVSRRLGETEDCFCERVHIRDSNQASCMLAPIARRVQCARHLGKLSGMSFSSRKYALCHLSPVFRPDCKVAVFDSVKGYRECLGISEEQAEEYYERMRAFEIPEGHKAKCKAERRAFEENMEEQRERVRSENEEPSDE